MNPLFTLISQDPSLRALFQDKPKVNLRGDAYFLSELHNTGSISLTVEVIRPNGKKKTLKLRLQAEHLSCYEMTDPKSDEYHWVIPPFLIDIRSRGLSSHRG